MTMVVRLRRARIPRNATMTVRGPHDAFRPEAVALAVAAFTTGVEAGLFASEPSPVTTLSLTEGRDGDHLRFTWEAYFPKLAPDAFLVLARLVAGAAPGAVRFELVEQAPEATLVVRGFEDDGAATIADVPWRVALDGKEPAVVRLVFHELPTHEIRRRTVEVLHAWAGVVALGGFAGAPPEHVSRCTPPRFQRESDREMTARFTELSAAHEAYEALFNALLTIDALAPLALVELPASRFP